MKTKSRVSDRLPTPMRMKTSLQKLKVWKTLKHMQLLHASPSQTLRPQTPKNIPPVIIKPKQKQDAEVTKTELKSKINPSQLNVSINSMKTAKNGVVVISCNNEQECQKLIRNIQEHDTEDKYTVQLPQMKNQGQISHANNK